jgi:ADP-ribosylation factor GTPase-activating protein 1
MDAFKEAELLRMERGGNKAWQDFYNKNTTSLPFDEATIKERYDSEVGEEWKERLACQVEDRAFDKAAFQKERQAILQKQASRSVTPAGGVRNHAAVSSTGSGAGSRTASPAPRGRITADQKAQNEAYFSRMGEANASRPDNLAPSQGGKYGGFGSAMPEPVERPGGGGIADDFTKDPVAAITKGFGWLGGMVSKQAKLVNDSYIQPTAKNVSLASMHATRPQLNRTRTERDTVQQRWLQ